MRFVGHSGQIRLGQPVDASVDVGLAFAGGKEVKVNIINGDVYSGTVSSEEDTIKKVRIVFRFMARDVITDTFLGDSFSLLFPARNVVSSDVLDSTTWVSE